MATKKFVSKQGIVTQNIDFDNPRAEIDDSSGSKFLVELNDNGVLEFSGKIKVEEVEASIIDSSITGDAKTLDGLSSDDFTLDQVTSFGNTTTNDIEVNDLVTSGKVVGPHEFFINPNDDVDGNPGTVVITGNVQIEGETTTIDATNLEVEDKTITVSKGATDSATANNSGLVVDGADARLIYKAQEDHWTFNKNVTGLNSGFIARNTQDTWFTAVIDNADSSSVPAFKGLDSNENEIASIDAVAFDGSGDGFFDLQGIWRHNGYDLLTSNNLVTEGGDVVLRNFENIFTAKQDIKTLKVGVNSNFQEEGSLSVENNIYQGGNRVIDVSDDVFKSWKTITSNYTANEKESLLADVSGGSFTITLPASPTIGTWVQIGAGGGDYSNNPLTVNGNGETIMGQTGNLTIDTTNKSIELAYNGDWRVIA